VAAAPSRLTLTRVQHLHGTNQQVIDGFGFSTRVRNSYGAKNQSLYGTLGMSLMRVQIVNDVNGASDGAWITKLPMPRQRIRTASRCLERTVWAERMG